MSVDIPEPKIQRLGRNTGLSANCWRTRINSRTFPKPMLRVIKLIFPWDYKSVKNLVERNILYELNRISLPEKNIRGILEFVFSYTCAHGGCGIYDLVYVVDKCMDYGIRENQCKEVMSRCYENISKHQQNDGGLAYDRNCCQTSFYGKGIAEPYPCGDVHGTTLFSMALVRIDKRLNLGLNLCPAVTWMR